MKYNIISIDDSRAAYKANIRKLVDGSEILIPGVDGRSVDLHEELDKRGLVIDQEGWFNATKGEIGVWLSTFDNWAWAAENEELLVFEDDAVPTVNFNRYLKMYRKDLPGDYGFLSLWVPENQYWDYLYDVKYDEFGRWEKVGPDMNVVTSKYNFGAISLARVYQGYGNVATIYSPDGATRLIKDAQQRGVTGPIDCWILERAHIGVIDGYAPKPIFAKAVDYDWPETTVHNTERHA